MKISKLRFLKGLKSDQPTDSNLRQMRTPLKTALGNYQNRCYFGILKIDLKNFRPKLTAKFFRNYKLTGRGVFKLEEETNADGTIIPVIKLLKKVDREENDRYEVFFNSKIQFTPKIGFGPQKDFIPKSPLTSA